MEKLKEPTLFRALQFFIRAIMKYPYSIFVCSLSLHKNPMMVVSEIKLYELLKAKLGNQEAEAFVEILEKKVDQKFDDAKQILATREDIANLRTELKTDIAN